MESKQKYFIAGFLLFVAYFATVFVNAYTDTPDNYPNETAVAPPNYTYTCQGCSCLKDPIIPINDSNLDTFTFIDKCNGAGNETDYVFKAKAGDSGPLYSSHPNQDSGLVLAMTFNNISEVGENYSSPSDGDVVYDYSKYHNNGTTHGGITYLPNGGRYGGAFQFDGVDDYVRIPNSQSLTLPDALTLEAWVYVNSFSKYPWPEIISKPSSYRLRLSSDGRVLFYVFSPFDGSRTISMTANAGIQTGKWYHIVGTWSTADGEGRVYVNGELKGTKPAHGSHKTTNESIYIGSNGGPHELFDGKIDEVRIYNRALTPDEIKMHYYSHLYRYYNNDNDNNNDSDNNNDNGSWVFKSRAPCKISHTCPALTVKVDPNPSRIIEPNGTVNFTINIINERGGNITLTELTDDKYGNLSGKGNCSTGNIIPLGGSYTCWFTGVIEGHDGNVFEDPSTNTVTAKGKRIDGGCEISGSGSATVEIDPSTNKVYEIKVTKTANTSEVFEPGGYVKYTIKVQNTGNQRMNLISLIDSMYGNLSNPNNPQIFNNTCANLPKEIFTNPYSCEFIGWVSGKDGDIYTNTINATAKNKTTTATDTDTAKVYIVKKTQAIKGGKVPNVSKVIAPGELVNFTVTVHNTGNSPNTLKSLIDSVYGDITYAHGNITNTTCQVNKTLGTGETYSCWFTAWVNGTPGDTHKDILNICFGDTCGSSSATIDIVKAIKSLKVEKTGSPSSVIEPGGNVTYVVTVTNNGTVPLTLKSLNDSAFGELNGTGTCSLPQRLLSNQSYTCSFVKYISGRKGDPPHVNNITAYALDDSNENVQGQTQTSVKIIFKAAPPLKVGLDYVGSGGCSGSIKTWHVSVINKNNRPVNITSLYDNHLGDVTSVHDSIVSTNCEKGKTISAGWTYECSFKVNLSLSGEYNLTVNVSDKLGMNASNTTSTNITVVNCSPGGCCCGNLTVEKKALITSVVSGGIAKYRLTLKNTQPPCSNLNIENMTDNTFGDITSVHGNITSTTCSKQIIDGLSSYTCYFEARIWDNNYHQHNNTLIVKANDTCGSCPLQSANDSASVDIVPANPSMQVKVIAQPSQILEPGGNITYIIEIKNTGNTRLNLTSLNDSLFGELINNTCQSAIIRSGETYSCTFVKTITGNASDSYTNIVNATALTRGNNSMINISNTSSAKVSIIAHTPSIRLLKTADPHSIPPTGSLVTFTIEIENTGNSNVTLDSLTDSVFGDLSGIGSCSVGQTIEVGKEYVCSFSKTINGGVPGSVAHQNTVTAKVSDRWGNKAQASRTTKVIVMPAIFINMTANPKKINIPSPNTKWTGPINFTVKIENHLNKSVKLYYLYDKIFNNITTAGHDNITLTNCSLPQNISAGDSYTCQFTAKVSGNIGDIFTHKVNAKAIDTDKMIACGDDNTRVLFVQPNPGVRLNKTVDNSPICLGQKATYTYEITNIGNTELTNCFLTDNKLGNLSGIFNLSIGEKKVYKSFSYPNETLTNIAKIVCDQANDIDNATVEVNIMNYSISLIPNTINASFGEKIKWTIFINNTGNIPLNISFNSTQCTTIPNIINLQQGNSTNISCISTMGCKNTTNLITANATGACSQTGLIKYINATVKNTNHCGDGLCVCGETFKTCPQDCKSIKTYHSNHNCQDNNNLCKKINFVFTTKYFCANQSICLRIPAEKNGYCGGCCGAYMSNFTINIDNKTNNTISPNQTFCFALEKGNHTLDFSRHNKYHTTTTIKVINCSNNITNINKSTINNKENNSCLCGNLICEPKCGETPQNCPKDCSAYPVTGFCMFPAFLEIFDISGFEWIVVVLLTLLSAFVWYKVASKTWHEFKDAEQIVKRVENLRFIIKNYLNYKTLILVAGAILLPLICALFWLCFTATLITPLSLILSLVAYGWIRNKKRD